MEAKLALCSYKMKNMAVKESKAGALRLQNKKIRTGSIN